MSGTLFRRKSSRDVLHSFFDKPPQVRELVQRIHLYYTLFVPIDFEFKLVGPPNQDPLSSFHLIAQRVAQQQVKSDTFHTQSVKNDFDFQAQPVKNDF